MGTGHRGKIRAPFFACLLCLVLSACSNPSSWMKDMWNFGEKQNPAGGLGIQASPVIGKYSGIYNAAIVVPIGAQAGSTIYYTLDGSDPTPSSSVYSGPIAIAGTVAQTDTGIHVLKAYARQSKYLDTPIVSATFIVDPWMLRHIGGGPDGNSNGIPPMNVSLNSPEAVCVDAQDNTYVADTGYCAVRKVNHSNGLAYIVAGTPGVSGVSGDGGLATAALLMQPTGVAVNAAGEVFIADSSIDSIRKIDTGGIISTVATGLSDPSALAVDAAGNLYICDTGGHRVWKLTPSLSLVLVAGDGTPTALPTDPAGDGGPAITARLNFPGGIAVHPSGFPIWISDSGDNRIRRVDSDGSIRTIAGNGMTSPDPTNPATMGEGGLASDPACRLNSPQGLALDPFGNLYIADLWDHRVRKIDPAGIISTAAGNGDNGVFKDGPLSNGNAWLSSISGLAADSIGRLYVVDGAFVRKIPNPNP